NSERVRVLALKKAEDSDELIVRIVELDGRGVPDVRLAFPAPVIAAREVNAQEQPLGNATQGDDAKIVKGQLVTSLGRYQPRTFAVKLAPAAIKSAVPQSAFIPLAYDLAVATRDGERIKAGFDGEGAALPAEMLPSELRFGGIVFRLGPADKANAMVARGQNISVPAGTRRLYVLAASTGDDERVAFRIGERPVDLTIQNWGGFIGQWDDRQWKQTEVHIPPRTPPAGTP